MAMTLRADKGAILSWNEMDANFKACLGVHNFLHVEERTANAATGLGGMATGAWRTRLFNLAVTNTITGASLASNQITLPAGDYYIQGRAPQHCSTVNLLRIERISPSAQTMLYGGVQYDANMTSDAQIFGKFSLTATSVIEMQHRVSVYNSAGYGGFGDVGQPYNIFAQLFIWKLT